MSQGNEYLIDTVFPIFSENYIIVHLKGEKWSEKGEQEVNVVCNEGKMRLKYIGYGVMNGQIALKLVPMADDKTDIEKLFNFFRGKYTPLHIELLRPLSS